VNMFDLNQLIAKSIADGRINSIDYNSIIKVAWQNNVSIAELNILMPNREKDFFSFIWLNFYEYFNKKIVEDEQFNSYGFSKKIYLMLSYGADFFELIENKSLLQVLFKSSLKSTYRMSIIGYAIKYANLIVKNAQDSSLDISYYTKRYSVFILICWSFSILLMTKDRSRFDKSVSNGIDKFKQIPQIKQSIFNKINSLKEQIIEVVKFIPFARYFTAKKFKDDNDLML
jgi:hypothetical protein